MDPRDVVDRLAALPRFANVPRAELEWLVARGELRRYAGTTTLVDAGAPVEEMYILLDGRAGVYMDKGTAWRKAVEARGGDVLGTMPYSRGRAAPGRLVVEDESTILAVHRTNFADLQQHYHALTAALVHGMIDRSRADQTARVHEDRLQSLGRLASGLAHELNNPASAASSGAQSLVQLRAEAEHAARLLMEARLSDTQLAVLDAVRAACGRDASSTRTALDQADREDVFVEWCERHDIESVGADALAASDVGLDDLDRLAGALPAATLGVAMRWVTSSCSANAIANQVATATGRIHDLVDAVKRFTFMDRESLPQEIDVAQGLADTLAMLQHKSSTNAVDVRLEVAPDLPRVYGFGSEINQVWEKLIDNAIDAAGRGGHVTVVAASRGDAVVVRVTDDGPGIPEAHHALVFDPFFTTKPVGHGTGLGLDLARRVVQFHRGDVHFTSEPGQTVFRVELPVSGVQLPGI